MTAPAPAPLAEGWGFPGLARKAHYFPLGETIALCGKWMFSGPREPDNGPSRDDCAACRRANDKVARP